MNVTGPDVKLLFCEGQPSSLDALLLDRLLIGRAGRLIVSCGGKHGMRAYIDGYLQSYTAPPLYLAFRDRDFDSIPGERVGLIRLRGEKPIFLSYRACLESYFLDAQLIDCYWNESSAAAEWRHGASPGVAGIRDWIETAARQIGAYQGVRWALAGLKPAERWPELPTTWTKGSGFLPDSLAQEACLTEAKGLVAEYATQSGRVSERRLLEENQHYERQFADPGFWEAGSYLVWFHGKDLLKAMQRLRPNSISLPNFCDWGVHRLNWQAHPDLKQLADAI